MPSVRPSSFELHFLDEDISCEGANWKPQAVPTLIVNCSNRSTRQLLVFLPLHRVGALSVMRGTSGQASNSGTQPQH